MQTDQGRDARRVRFETIEGLQRRDLGIASEIWLRDVCDAKWASREASRLAAHFVRYMSSPDAKQLAMSRIEHQVQLTREEILAALRLLRIYRAVELYSVEGDELRVALHLSTLQRLQTLEARHRLEFLTRQTVPEPVLAAPGSRWVPQVATDEVEIHASASAGLLRRA